MNRERYPHWESSLVPMNYVNTATFIWNCPYCEAEGLDLEQAHKHLQAHYHNHESEQP